MDREGFRNRLKQYKKAREENPGLKYWEWKNIPKYDEGTNSVWVPTEEEMLRSKKKNLTDYRSEDFPPMIRFFGEEDHIKNVIRKRVNDPNAFSEKQFLDISDKYYTPFLKDKKIVLTDSENLTGATLSENLLDSIYKYSKIVGIPLQDAVGLAAQESTFGKYEGWMDPTSKMSVLAATGDVTQGFDPIKNLHNHTFVDDVYYSPANEARNWFYRKSPNEHRDTLSVRAAKELETNPNYYIQEGVKRYHSVKNPWIHAFEQYKHGKYNTNDKHHTSDVQHAGKLVLEDPAVQKWVKEKGIAYAEGGEVEPDPLEVLERSRPKINGIPINDKPLSGTDPLGELYLNLVSGNAVKKQVMNGINGIVRKSFYNSYKDFLKAGWNRHKAYDYASPGIGINVLPGITKGFDYTIRGANYIHAAEKFIE